MVGLALIITGSGLTVTVTIALPDPQISVLVSVYVVVKVGVTIVIGQVGQLVDGDHENDPAPLPVKVVLLPMHIAASGPASAEGVVEGVIVIISVAVPQVLVTVSV